MSKEVQIGQNNKKALIGGDNPVLIQSMCNTKTENIEATVNQITKLEQEKCDIVRVSVPNEQAAEAITQIVKKINIPLVADIHFDYRMAIKAIENGADKIRINPGNIGSREKLRQIVETTKKFNAAIRVGINAGSMEKDLLEKYGHPTPEALCESAEKNVALLEKMDFQNIVVSLKTSDVLDTIKAYKLFAEKSDYPLHIGVTEAGTLLPGIVRNSIGIGSLLQEGIGDTIRVSLTADPVEEVKAAKEILKSVHLYDKEPVIISCPTCSRTEINVEKLAKEVTKRTCRISKPLKISVLGCAVNGPGEAKEADYGIAGGLRKGVLYRRGEIVKVVPEDELIDELMFLIEKDNA